MDSKENKNMILEERITRLEDIESIRYLQAKYQRCLDSRDFDGLSECFDVNAIATYDSGKMSYNGKDNIINFLMRVMKLSRPSSHLIHGGEIDVLTTTQAKAKWILEDQLTAQEAFVSIHGSAIYNIEYIKKDEKWLISKISYTRFYQYVERRSIFNLFSLSKKDIFKELKRKSYDELGDYGKKYRRKRFARKKKQ